MAVRKYSGVVLGQLDDQVASFGIDPSQQASVGKRELVARGALAMGACSCIQGLGFLTEHSGKREAGLHQV